jgi:hypothetical protein
MSSNAIGTLFRVSGLCSMIVLFWYLLSNSLYFLAVGFFEIEFDYMVSIYILLFLFMIRAFYPKNVFK